MNRKSFLAALAVCAVTMLGLQASAKANAEVSQLPESLITAEAFDAKLAQDVGAASVDESIVGDQEIGSDESLALNIARPGRGGGVVYRPGPRPYPRPYPVAYPRPYPYPRGYTQCYAQSPANGLTYSGTGYYAADAQNAALSVCCN